MWSIEYSGSFKKDIKRMEKRGCKMELFKAAVRILEQTGTLPPSYHPHILGGKWYAGLWEAHLAPDWLLVWDRKDDILTLLLTYTGTHSDLF